MISGTNLGGTNLQIRRDGLVGDFEVGFLVDEFAAGAPGAFIWAAISDPETGRTFTAGFDSYPRAGVSTGEMPGGATHSVTTTSLTSGGMSFRRTGTALEVLAGTKEIGTLLPVNDFTTGPVRIWLLFGSNSGAVAPVSTARLGKFFVESGEGVTADAFDCDSLIR